MSKVQLGQTDIYVYPVGYGCMGITHAFGAPMSKENGIKVIQEAYRIGYTFFDTAECYTGQYEDGTLSYNEEIVGEALHDVRDKVVIATKFGVILDENELHHDSSPATIRKSIEGSLKRLNTSYIDIYYQHRIDPKVEPEVVAGVMKELIQEGKIRAWGISEVDEDYLRRAHAVCPVAVIQNRYSMMARWHEKLFPVCKQLSVTYVGYSPLANGFLSGKYDSSHQFDKTHDYRSRMPQFSEEGHQKSQQLLDYLNQLCGSKKCTMAQISLAWMIHKGIVPIPGSRKVERMQENFDSAKIHLTDSEIEDIDKHLDTMNFLVYVGLK